MLAEGKSKEPIWPIMGRMVGKGSSGPGLNDTLRTLESLMMEWMGPRSYVAGEIVRSLLHSRENLFLPYTSVLVPVDRVGRSLGVGESASHYVNGGQEY